MILPLAVVLACVTAAPPQAADARAEAERLARSGARAEALRRFETIAAGNPADVEARLWIARLHVWMGKPALAIAAFESILAADPSNVEALTGAAIAHMNEGRTAAAEEALQRAYRIMPTSAEVLAALGRLNRFEGRLTPSLAYYDRAVGQSPLDQDIRDARDVVFAQRAHRVEASYLHERFDPDVPDTNAGGLDVNLRAGDRARVSANIQTQQKFDRTETRGGGGAEWRINRSTVVHGAGLFSAGATVYPGADVSAIVETSHRALTWLFSGRYLHFSDSDVGIGSIGLAWSASDATTITFHYYRSQTAFETTGETAGNNSGSIRLAQRAARRLRLYAGYARGYESFETVTADELEQRGAHTVSAGAAIDVGPRFVVAPAFELQRRDDDSRVTSVLLTFVHRF